MTMRLLAADIHLSGAHPRRCRDFLSALSAAAADEIYLLGDLFDAWPGDDEDGAWAAEIKAALAEKTRGGTAIFIMRGNRDFLLGRRFCENTGCRLLADMHSLEEGGRRCLLTHGDLLSGEDGYLFWRKIAHSRWFALLATMLPLGWRRKAATMLRGQSQKHRRRAEIKLSAAEAALKKTPLRNINSRPHPRPRRIPLAVANPANPPPPLPPRLGIGIPSIPFSNPNHRRGRLTKNFCNQNCKTLLSVNRWQLFFGE